MSYEKQTLSPNRFEVMNLVLVALLVYGGGGGGREGIMYELCTQCIGTISALHISYMSQKCLINGK